MRLEPFLISLLALAGTLPLSARDVTPQLLAGHWEGVIFASPGEYEVDVSVDFSLDTASKLRGQLWFPTQQVQRYETLDLVLRGPAISFKVRDENNVISFFDGEIDSAEAKITGRLTEGFQRVPFTLRQRIDHPSAPAVIRLADDGSGLREAFNRAAGHVRLLMILSPSAFSSRMALKLVQRYFWMRIQIPGSRSL